MIYLLLFGLDFYNNLITLLNIFTIGTVSISLLGVVMYLVLYIEAVNNDIKDDIIYRCYMFGYYIIKRKYYILFLIIITSLLPAPKTVTIAAGLYTGEQLVKYAQETPLAKKAYQLAEKKIDELLSEPESSNKEGKEK